MFEKLPVTGLLLMAAAIYQPIPVEDEKRQHVFSVSQADTSQLFFSMNAYPGEIETSGFSHPKEFSIRNGISNFFAKAKKGEKVTVAYIGGSITYEQKGYRLQSAAWIQKMFPRTAMRGINAGVSGTGTDLGACRIQEQVLLFQPDLVFIEFAVNGAYTKGMEGMVRQIKKSNPATDICFIYTIYSGQTEAYAKGSMPNNIRALDSIADHYKIPSIHLGLQAAYLEKIGKLEWKGDPEKIRDRLVFSTDGTHPLEEGGNLYASAIARAFSRMLKVDTMKQEILPNALINDNWEDAKMLDPLVAARFDGQWSKINVAVDPKFKRYEGWFPYIMKAEGADAGMHFSFNGTAFGFFDIGGPEVGQLQIEVDGKRVFLTDKNLRGTHIMTTSESIGNSLINRFNVFCNNRYRGQYQLIEVEPGIHNVSIIVSPAKANKAEILGVKNSSDIIANPQKYDRTEFYIGKLLLRGNIVDETLKGL